MVRRAFSLALVLCCALPAAAQALQGAFNAPGRYEIESVVSGLVLDVSSSDHQTVQEYERNEQTNQQWDIQPADDGYFYIRSVHTGKALSRAEGSNRDGNHVIVYGQSSSGEQWQIVSVGPAQFQIVSKSGKALDVPNGSRKAGTRLQIWSTSGGSNQKFRLVLVSAAPNWVSPGEPTAGQPPRAWDNLEAARACKGEVARRIADLPMSDISADPISPDAQGNYITIWRTVRGSSGYCRVNRLNRVVEFKVEEMSQ